MASETYFRCHGRRQETADELKKFLTKKFSLSAEQWDLICNYLRTRGVEAKREKRFGVVFAITRYCNLNCAHCGVNARMVKSSPVISFELTTDQIFAIVDKVEDYIKQNNFKPFLIFGGGEPSLRPDLEEILAYAGRKLGIQNVGFCTNGTLLDMESLLELGKHVGVIETSLDGFEGEHNSLRDPKGITSTSNPFAKTFELISQAVRYEDLRNKLEVSSIVIKKNMRSLPLLARRLREIGLTNYSVHRAIPIGRMSRQAEEILNMYDYLQFFIEMVEVWRENPAFKLHIHHSLESIYSALFLGKDIHKTKLPMGSGRHSIGIDWNGFVCFDPWSLIPPFNMIRAGNILDKNQSLENLMNDPQGVMKLAAEIRKGNIRCKQCKMPCGGGMRFNAISHHISKYKGMRVSKSHLIAGFSEVDPACPLYDQNAQEVNNGT